jgi:hypothetical protein
MSGVSANSFAGDFAFGERIKYCLQTLLDPPSLCGTKTRQPDASHDGCGRGDARCH